MAYGSSVALSDHNDPHVQPYAPRCTLANRIVRWDFPKLEELLGVAIPMTNKGREIETPDLIWPARFDALYADDITLWTLV